MEHRDLKQSIVKTYENVYEVCDIVFIHLIPQGKLNSKPKPFIFLSIDIAPEFVDVNVHPTKQEVHFLHEIAAIKKIAEAISNTLYEWKRPEGKQICFENTNTNIKNRRSRP